MMILSRDGATLWRDCRLLAQQLYKKPNPTK